MQPQGGLAETGGGTRMRTRYMSRILSLYSRDLLAASGSRRM